MRCIAWLLAVALALLSAVGCAAPEGEALAAENQELVLYCPHSMDFYLPIVSEFEQRYGIKVRVVNAGTVEFLSRIAQEQDDPQGDILWGGTVSTVSTRSELFEDYVSVNDQYFPPEYRNAEGNMTRFTYILSVLMVNTDLIGDIEITGYESLLAPELRGRIAAANPSKASSGKEQLVNMLYAMGKGDPEQGWDYVEKLADNLDGKLLDGSSDVYTKVASGEYVVGLSFEEGAANYVYEGSPIRIVYMREGVIGNPDGVYIIKNAKHMENARLFVDFVTGMEVESVVSEKLNRRPLRTDVPDPQGFPGREEINLIDEDPEQVEAHIAQWTQRFLSYFGQTQQKSEQN